MSTTSEVKQQLLGRSIEHTAQDMSASLPADSETKEEPLSRFRRQGIRPRLTNLEPEERYSKYSVPRTPYSTLTYLLVGRRRGC